MFDALKESLLNNSKMILCGDSVDASLNVSERFASWDTCYFMANNKLYDNRKRKSEYHSIDFAFFESAT